VLGGTVPPRVLIAKGQLFVNVDLAENGRATAVYSAELSPKPFFDGRKTQLPLFVLSGSLRSGY
jgi:hypothetical protein